MKVQIDVWQFVPPQADEEPGMPTYRVAGLIGEKPFCCEVSFEIDGRDCEYKHLWGVNVADWDSPDAWESLLEAFTKLADWNADFQKRADEYRASA